MPIIPPRWCMISSERALYPTILPCRQPTSRLILRGGDQCACGAKYSAERDISVRSCTVYTILQPHRAEIEIQPCPVCPPNRRRFIGPDLSESGMFNLNNSILMSHEVLHEYTSAYTVSETPFAAFVAQMSRRYEEIGQSFVGNDLFRSLWFGYAHLLSLENDMQCPTCGPTPSDVIFDGVTLAYMQKQIREGLAPPTLIAQNCLVRDNVRRVSFQSFLPLGVGVQQDALKLLESSTSPCQDDPMWQRICVGLSDKYDDILKMLSAECFREAPRPTHRELLKLVCFSSLPHKRYC